MDEEIKFEPINGDEDAPVTKAEFNQALTFTNTAFENLGNKIDGVESRLGKKITESFSASESHLETKIAESERRLGEKLDDILAHIDAAVEARDIELGAAKKETVQLHGEQIETLQEDVNELQRAEGIPTDR